MKNYLLNKFHVYRCYAIVLLTCLRIMFKGRRGEQYSSLVDRETRLASMRLLRAVRAHYTLRLSPDLKLNRDEAYIFMSNHQSLFDLPLIGAALLPFVSIRVLVKQELFRLPIFGNILRRSGCICIDRQALNQNTNYFVQASQAIKKGISLLIFVEGTRSRTGELLPFKLSGFRLALEAKATIIPVGIQSTRDIIVPKTDILHFNQHVKINVGAPIKCQEDITPENLKMLVGKVRASIHTLMAKEKDS